jgi:hypothetical protein|nr:MAG TPA: hypothetical protein [Caudoviricetes sp.]
MAAKTNFRSRVMKYAWQIYRATRRAWRECMLQAWRLYRLAKAMRKGTVVFSYLKSDGIIRQAKGTLLNTPSGASLGGKRITKPSYKTMAYYDIERGNFRCFKVENLIGF